MARAVEVEEVEEALDAEPVAAPVLDPEPGPEAESPDERPAWLPDQFLTPEALVESYGEAQAALTRTSQRLSELEQENEFLRAERLSVAERVSNLERAYLAGVGR